MPSPEQKPLDPESFKREGPADPSLEEVVRNSKEFKDVQAAVMGQADKIARSLTLELPLTPEMIATSIKAIKTLTFDMPDDVVRQMLYLRLSNTVGESPAKAEALRLLSVPIGTDGEPSTVTGS